MSAIKYTMISQLFFIAIVLTKPSPSNKNGNGLYAG